MSQSLSTPVPSPRPSLPDFSALAAKLQETAQALLAGGPEFDIPLDRQQLADFLAVDRSAMSAELSNMQRDGLLRTDRSCFTLCQPEDTP